MPSEQSILQKTSVKTKATPKGSTKRKDPDGKGQTESDNEDTKDTDSTETEADDKRSLDRQGDRQIRKDRTKEVVKVRKNPNAPTVAPTRVTKAKGKPIINTRVKTNVDKKAAHDMSSGDTMWKRMKKASGWPI